MIKMKKQEQEEMEQEHRTDSTHKGVVGGRNCFHMAAASTTSQDSQEKQHTNRSVVCDANAKPPFATAQGGGFIS